MGVGKWIGGKLGILNPAKEGPLGDLVELNYVSERVKGVNHEELNQAIHYLDVLKDTNEEVDVRERIERVCDAIEKELNIK